MTRSNASDAQTAQAIASVRAVAEVRMTSHDPSPANRWSARLFGTSYVALAVGLAATQRHWDGRMLLTMALLSVAHGLACRIEFESAAGAAIPTQPILVAALFLLPGGLVPAVVLIGLASTENIFTNREHRLHRFFVTLTSAWHCVGPVMVLALANVHEASLSHWPVYLAALAAQFVIDGLANTLRCLALKTPLQELAGMLPWAWAVDTLLAPIGLIAVIACNGSLWSILFASTPIALFALLARDRTSTLDKAVSLTEAFDQAVIAARRDVLTDINNRRAWTEATARAAIEYEADPLAHPVTVVIGDLDDLKMMNDLFGHDAGDQLLRAAADVFRRAAPADAMVARLGGDEFGILVVGDATTPDQLIADIQREMENYPKVRGFAVGISIGVASCPEFDAVEDALLAADARLYADKTYRKTRATQRRAPLWPVQNSASA